MTPDDIARARKRLSLTAAGLGRALELEGRDPGLTVRRWETGMTPISGPARVAIRLMLEAQARQTLQDAVSEAQAIIGPTPAQTGPQPPESSPAPVDPPARSRRRG